VCGQDFELAPLLDAPIGYQNRQSANRQTATDFYKVLLEGSLAGQLFRDFENYFLNSLKEQTGLFESLALGIVEGLEEMLKSQALLDLWDIRRDEHQRQIASTEQQGLLIEIVNDPRAQDFVRISRGELEKRFTDPATLKPIIAQLQQVDRMRGLLALHQTLSQKLGHEIEQ
jgi:hypothetical protein